MIRITTDDKAASGVTIGFFNVLKTGAKVLALSKTQRRGSSLCK